MRISLRLLHKQGELVEEAEGQRGTATYTGEAAAKTNLDDWGKREAMSASRPWAWATGAACGCRWVSRQAVPQLRAEKGLSDRAAGSDVQPLHGNVLFEFHCL